MQNKKVIQVKDCLIGAGRTKICVPLLSHTLPELLTEAEAAAALAPDLIEWRVDYFQTAANTAAVTAALSQLRTVIPTIPLIVTCRDYAEGGFTKLPQAARISLLQALLETAQIDLLDVEFSLGQAAVASLLAAAHRQGVYVIVSYHNFVQTPAPSALYDKLLQLQAVGADIVKLPDAARAAGCFELVNCCPGIYFYDSAGSCHCHFHVGIGRYYPPCRLRLWFGSHFCCRTSSFSTRPDPCCTTAGAAQTDRCAVNVTGRFAC